MGWARQPWEAAGDQQRGKRWARAAQTSQKNKKYLVMILTYPLLFEMDHQPQL